MVTRDGWRDLYIPARQQVVLRGCLWISWQSDLQVLLVRHQHEARNVAMNERISRIVQVTRGYPAWGYVAKVRDYLPLLREMTLLDDLADT
ncbi:MAG: hypothetical protein AB7L09_01515 [Nitrospira sp.]